MEKIIKKISTLKSKEDFIELVELLIIDLQNHPDEWENKTVESYLMAIASWTESMEGYYHNLNLPLPQNIDWKVFANILIAAKMYE